MNTIFRTLFLGTFFTARLAYGGGCQHYDDWPDLSEWVCALGEQMHKADTNNPNFERTVRLLVDADPIAAIRESMRGQNLATCRRYRDADLHIPLERILNHQSIGRAFLSEKTSFATAEFWNVLDGRGLEVCEFQILADDSDPISYQQEYYFRYGSQRRGEHLAIEVTSTWPAMTQ